MSCNGPLSYYLEGPGGTIRPLSSTHYLLPRPLHYLSVSITFRYFTHWEMMDVLKAFMSLSSELPSTSALQSSAFSVPLAFVY